MADDINSIVEEAASAHGVDPKLLGRLIHIESGGDPRAQTGSHYGLGQFTSDNWGKYGAGGDIWNARDNAHAFARKISEQSKDLGEKLGRNPEPVELYMVHQQGESGGPAHLANPGGVAWKNVAGFYPNERIAKSAIWGNIPDSAKESPQFNKEMFPGGVDDVTSGAFVSGWAKKIDQGDYKSDPGKSSPSSFANYLSRGAQAIRQAPRQAWEYWNALPASTGDYGSIGVGGMNSAIDTALRIATQGNLNLPKAVEYTGLPSGGVQESMDRFQGAYAGPLQVAGDIGQFALGSAGPSRIPEAPQYVSRGTEAVGRAADVGATAFENAAKAQQRGGVGVFAPVFPGDPRYATAMALRGEGKGATNQKIWNKTRGPEGQPGTFFDPGGNLLTPIPDVNARVSPNLSNYKAGESVRLGNIYDHPELYKKFPGLENTRVNLTSETKRSNRQGFPIAYTSEDGSISIPVADTRIPPEQLFPHLKAQLSKVTHYLTESESPLRPESFKDRPGYEVAKLDRLHDRVDTALARTNKEDPSYEPLFDYREYLRGYKDRIDAIKLLKDEPETLAQNPIVQSTPFGRTLANRVMSANISGRDARITSSDVDRVIAESLHNLSAGSQGARYAMKNVETPGERLAPPYATGYGRSLARISPDSTDQQIREFAKQWRSFGSGRDFAKSGSRPLDVTPAKAEMPIEPYQTPSNRPGRADGGSVKMPDQRYAGDVGPGSYNLTARDLEGFTPQESYDNRRAALNYFTAGDPLSVRQPSAPPLPEKRGIQPWASTGLAPLTPAEKDYADKEYVYRLATRQGVSADNTSGSYSLPEPPVHAHQYMAQGVESGDDKWASMGAGNPHLGFLIDLHNKGNQEAGKAIRAIHEGRGDPEFWAKYISKYRGYADGGQVYSASPVGSGMDYRQKMPGGGLSRSSDYGLAKSNQSNTQTPNQIYSASPVAATASTPQVQAAVSPMTSPTTQQAPAYAQTSDSVVPQGGVFGGNMGAQYPLNQNASGLSNYADGGQVTDSPDGNASVDGNGVVQDPSGSGPRADQIEASVPEDSHVIPVEVLAKIGHGDPEKGAMILRAIIERLAMEASQEQPEANGAQSQGQPPQQARAGGKVRSPSAAANRVRVRLSNQEQVLSPDQVGAVGGGNIDAGHAALDRIRMQLRS